MADLTVAGLTAHGTILDADLAIVGDTSGNAHKATFSVHKDYYLGKGAGGRIMVASADAPSDIRRRADIKCTNSDDDGDINTALASGNVDLTDGDYAVHEKIRLNYPGHMLVGTGRGGDMTGAGGGSIGRGRGTRLLLLSGFADTSAIEVMQTGATRPAGYVTIRDLLIEGGNFGTAVDGIHYRGFDSVIDNVHVRRMTGHGINLHGYSTAEIAGTGWSTYDTLVTNCQCELNAGSGLYFQNGTDVHVVGGIYNTNTLSGFHHDGGASVQMTNVHCHGNDLHAVHLDGAGSRDVFIGCKFEHSGNAGFHLDGSSGTGMTSVQIIGCKFGMSGELAAVSGTYSHIKFTGTGASDDAVIVGNTFHNADSAVKLAKWCIDCGAVAGGVLITGNNFRTSLSAAGVTDGIITYTGTFDGEQRGNVGIPDHSRTTYTAPTVTMNSGSGTSPPAAVRTGNDRYGTITWGTGTSPNNSGNQFTLNFGTTIPTTGNRVIIQCNNTATFGVQPVVVTPASSNNAGFSVKCEVAPAGSQANTVYSINYWIAS